MIEDEIILTTSTQTNEINKKKLAAASAAKRFDKLFKPSKVTSNTTMNKDEKAIVNAPEGSVEYWNQMRASLGLKKLKE